jgi:FlaG/FlaF family flagellin (archaellin)
MQLVARQKRMKSFKNSRKGLSTVVTTLIILVVAVLLASIVTFYAINVVTTRVQEESLQIFKQHLWHNGTTYAEGAFLIINTGGRDVVIDKISVRGQESAWTTVYYNKTTNTISNDLYYIVPNLNGTLLGQGVTLGVTTYSLSQASNDLILRSGWSMIVYTTNPDSISVNDIGVTVGFTVFTANAQYYKECNVGASV